MYVAECLIINTVVYTLSINYEHINLLENSYNMIDLRCVLLFDPTRE